DHYIQVYINEKPIPYHSPQLSALTPGATRINLSVEEARDRQATWVEEAIFYSLGSGRVLQWLDRWLINPILHLVAAYKTNKPFRRLQAILEKPHADSILGSGQEEHKGG